MRSHLLDELHQQPRRLAMLARTLAILVVPVLGIVTPPSRLRISEPPTTATAQQPIHVRIDGKW
jgi:hypothetical protein